MYTEQDLVRIAKRENNNKRKYLVVNRLQGKHIPVKPQEALTMFRALADTLQGRYKSEKLLVIGFAETATAIGAAVAIKLGADYIQTTRELVPNARYLYFSEEHSHATEQKLVKDDIDQVIDIIDRIVFVEDEVTTGKTILNIIHIFKKRYSKQIKFSVASILNGMDEAALSTYQGYKIELFWLLKTNHAAYTQIAEAYQGDGRYILCKNCTVRPDIQHIKTRQHMDTRHIVSAAQYQEDCELLYQEIVSQIDLDNTQNLLVLGTEEYMYPALFVAGRLEEQGKAVSFHATTRSPIAVSTQESYPFHVRYELYSLYDSRRTTYIYELQKYDTVVIMTDAAGDKEKGVTSLVCALKSCGNERIILVD